MLALYNPMIALMYSNDDHDGILSLKPVSVIFWNCFYLLNFTVTLWKKLILSKGIGWQILRYVTFRYHLTNAHESSRCQLQCPSCISFHHFDTFNLIKCLCKTKNSDYIKCKINKTVASLYLWKKNCQIIFPR